MSSLSGTSRKYVFANVACLMRMKTVEMVSFCNLRSPFTGSDASKVFLIFRANNKVFAVTEVMYSISAMVENRSLSSRAICEHK